MNKVIGKKIDQTRIFTPDGEEIAVTKIGINHLKTNKNQEIRLEEILAVGDKVKVTGTSKGKGFAGVVKRWKFAGGPRTHGQSDRERAPGSIGQTTTPGRVYKGKKMAGRMGGKRVTFQGLKIVAIKPEEKMLIVKGLIPGPKGSQVVLVKK